MLSNYEKWLKYTEELPSPQSYVEWSWRYIIAAALQRRVWMPPDHHRMYANLYLIFVGRSGLGKGLCIREIMKVLSHWKLKDAIKIYETHMDMSQEERVRADMGISAQMEKAKAMEMDGDNATFEDPVLIPVAPKSTTFEALVTFVAKNYRRVQYRYYNDTLAKFELKSYGHSSTCFCLEELASLLRKKTHDTVTYLLELYDCPEEYGKDTKNSGKDRLIKGCLNMVSGATPDHIKEMFSDKLLNQGFGSRNLFIYADEDRHSDRFFIPDLTAEQISLKNELLLHVRNLTSLYGPIIKTPGVDELLAEWWKTASTVRINKDSRMDGYYSRKKANVLKLILIEHFSESTSMEVTIKSVDRAIETLDKTELNMHKAIIVDAENKIFNIGEAIIKMLAERKEVSDTDVKIDLFRMGGTTEIEEALEFLRQTGQIDIDQQTDKDTGEKVVLWKIKKI